ncbi:hypothetical protein [Pelagicoccus mobilis]|uniref:Uncharacterized protein n=1 Tax=Pelagicoccus mobilis TaxID=415221 RepID=A0A934VSN1_9BACT|nr:hypothetical protein [Pelagicoccus mobilis]MBK1878843.1 hypothetical protein [Pelagicoccus mobilis]
MPLREIQLNLEGNEGHEPEHFCLEHVEHIFMDNLPKKIDIDGHEKLIINCFAKRSEDLDRFVSLKPTIGSFASFEMSGFDTETFRKHSIPEKEKVAALWIRNALAELSERFEIPIEAINTAHARTVESGFRKEWIRKQSSKSRGDRKLRLETHCVYDHSGISVTLHIKSRQKTIAKTSPDSGRKMRGIKFDYDSVVWEEDCVCIKNAFGDPYLRFRILEDNTVELLGSTKAVRLMQRGESLIISTNKNA